MKLMKDEWLRGAGRLRIVSRIVCLLIAIGLPGPGWMRIATAQAVNTTTVQGTLYLANGQPGSGSVRVSWPGFTTANGQAVVADSTTVTVGADGFLSVNLAPNQGATPAGLYYTAVLYMSDGSVNTQYWVVPAAAQATLAQVQAQVMPAAQAVQAVSKEYVDQSIAQISQSSLTSSGGTLTGPLYLNGDPTQPLQAADKHYVDSAVSQATPIASGSLGQIAYYSANGTSISGLNTVPLTAGGTGASTAKAALQNLGGISSSATSSQTLAGPLNVPTVNGVQFISQTASDPCAAIAAAIAALPAGGGKIDASGVPGGSCASTLAVNKSNVELDFGSGTFLFNGNPGISVTGGNVTITGKGSTQPYMTPGGTVLQSGVAAPLIVVTGGNNFHLRDINLFGNSIGTLGVVAPTAGNQYQNVTITYFQYIGLDSPTGVAMLNGVWANHNGEGALIGSDTSVSGQTQFELNTPGNGLQVISGGNIITCQSCDHNGYYNLYLDGRPRNDWAASTAYTQYQEILPTTNNAGGYLYSTVGAGSSSGTRPNFPQTPGATVTDGGVTWLNLGIYGSVSTMPANNVSYSHLVGDYVDDGGMTGAGGNVRIEGSGGTAAWIDISNLVVFQVDINAGSVYEPVKALELIGTNNIEVSGFQWYGSNWNGAGADTGGLYISNSSAVTVSNFTSLYTATTPVYITGSYFVTLHGAVVNKVGSSGTATASTYCAHIDTSSVTVIDDFTCTNTNSWAHGIYDAGTNTTIANYKNYTPNAATDDTLNAIAVEEDANGVVNKTITGTVTTWGGNFNIPYGNYLGSSSGISGNWVNRRYIWSLSDSQDETCLGVPSSSTTGADASVCRFKLGNNGNVVMTGQTTMQNGNTLFLDSDAAGTHKIWLNGSDGSSIFQGAMAVNNNIYIPYGSYLGDNNNWVNRRYIWSVYDSGGDETCLGVPTSSPAGADNSTCQFKISAGGYLVARGQSTFQNGYMMYLDKDAAGTHEISLDAWGGNGTFLGNISAVGGAFSGAVSGTTGTFSGIVTGANDAQRTSSTSINATTFTTTGLALPSIPISTTKTGRCVIFWQMSSTSYTATFGIGMNNTPTGLWGGSTVTYAATGTSNWLAFSQTATAATAISTAATAGAANTTYRAEIDFTLQTGATNPVAITLYGEVSNASGTLSIQPGSACYWLP